MQLDYAPFLRRLTPVRNVRDLWTPGTPDADPNSSYVSGAISGESIQLELSDTTGADGTNELAVWDLGQLDMLGIGFDPAGTSQLIVARFQLTTDPGDTGWSVGLAIADPANYATQSQGISLSRQTSANIRCTDLTGNTSPANLSGTTGIGIFSQLPDGSDYWQVRGIGSDDMSDTGNRRLVPLSTGHLYLIAGCDSSANTGPHTGAAKIEIACFGWGS